MVTPEKSPVYRNNNRAVDNAEVVTESDAEVTGPRDRLIATRNTLIRKGLPHGI